MINPRAVISEDRAGVLNYPVWSVNVAPPCDPGQDSGKAIWASAPTFVPVPISELFGEMTVHNRSNLPLMCRSVSDQVEYLMLVARLIASGVIDGRDLWSFVTIGNVRLLSRSATFGSCHDR